MDVLDSEKRAIVELSYYKGLSDTEIAKRIKRDRTTVAKYKAQALRLLRRRLAELYPD
jgi:DNA-directed RNA polymerase specialized sigma24 family protein